MTLLDAQQIGTSHDCAWPGCPREARDRGGYCDQGHVGAPRPVPDPAPRAKSTASPVCRADGCTEPRVFDRRGAYVGLCATHKDLLRRANAARKTSDREAAKTVKPPQVKGQAKRTPAAPKPRKTAVAPESRTTRTPQVATRVESTSREPLTLVQLAQAAEDTRRQAALAIEAHYAAKAALQEALDSMSAPT